MRIWTDAAGRATLPDRRGDAGPDSPGDDRGREVRVGIISVFVDYHRRGRKNPHSLQPQIGAPARRAASARRRDRDRQRDLAGPRLDARFTIWLFLSSMHSDMDRARQISHYWRRRGAKTVIGGSFAGSFPELCEPWFDAVVVGDPEGSVPQVYADFCAGSLKRRYVSPPYVPHRRGHRASTCFPERSTMRSASKRHAAARFPAISACLPVWARVIRPADPDRPPGHRRGAADAGGHDACAQAANRRVLRQQHRGKPGVPASACARRSGPPAPMVWRSPPSTSSPTRSLSA